MLSTNDSGKPTLQTRAKGYPGIAKCLADEKRNIRYVGGGAPADGTTLFLACSSP